MFDYFLMYFRCVFFLAWSILMISLLPAQVERVYDRDEQLVTINPLNEAGIHEGLGYSFHENGGISRETPFVEGQVQGEEKEFDEMGQLVGLMPYQDGQKHGTYRGFYADGSPKMEQAWTNGKRQGPMVVYYQGGALRMFAWMDHDSVLLAQHFAQDGQLKSEKVGLIYQPLDTNYWRSPRIYFPEGTDLTAGNAVPAKVCIPGVPADFIRFYSPDGEVGVQAHDAFPLLLTPDPEAKAFRLFLRIKTHQHAQPSMVRQLKLAVAHP
ncbi:MAG: hypothetical protein AAF399_16205 [Bacteroidota bacterium]